MSIPFVNSHLVNVDKEGIDKEEIDKEEIDKVGIDKVGIDEVGRYPPGPSMCFNKGIKPLVATNTW